MTEHTCTCMYVAQFDNLGTYIMIAATANSFQFMIYFFLLLHKTQGQVINTTVMSATCTCSFD